MSKSPTLPGAKDEDVDVGGPWSVNWTGPPRHAEVLKLIDGSYVVATAEEPICIVYDHYGAAKRFEHNGWMYASTSVVSYKAAK